MKFVEWLRVFPPYLVRALARDRRRKRTPLTLEQLVDNARSMEMRRDARWINEVSSRSTWAESRLDEITDFFAITGFSFASWNRERAYMLRTFGRQVRKFSHIDQLPEAEREFILGLIVRHRDHISEILIRMHNIQ